MTRGFRLPWAGASTPDAVGAWAATIERADGLVLVTAEYNHGYPALLETALDHAFPEFDRKPAACIG